MKTNSNKKQNNLLGEFGYKILNEVNRKQNVSIYSLPGIGLDTIAKEIVREFLNQSQKNRVINIYPHESSLSNNNEISKLLIEKYTLENPSEDSYFSSINDLMNYFGKEKLRLLVVLNKINRYKFISELDDYLYYLYKGSSGRVTTLVTEVSAKESINPINKLLSNRFCFKGFTDEDVFTSLVNRIRVQMDGLSSKKLSKDDVDNIFSLTFGHAGLTKEIIKGGSTEIQDLNPNITNRLNSTLQQLDRDKISWEDRENLEKLGITNNGVLGGLYDSYLKKFPYKNTNAIKNLTSTEEEIFRFLNNQPDFVSVDLILNHLEKTKFDTQSMWALYKHINNLKKKLEKENIIIESKRNSGYKIKKSTQLK